MAFERSRPVFSSEALTIAADAAPIVAQASSAPSGPRPRRAGGAPIMASTVDTSPRERFEELVRQYGRLVVAAVARVAGRSGASLREDIAQDVLLALWKQVEREQAIEHPASYVYKAAVRATVRILRRERRRGGEPWPEGAAEAPAAPEADDPHAVALSRERAALLEAGLEALALDRGRAVRAHLSGFDVREIMSLYGWTYQKTRNLIARGMADLRAELRRRGFHG